MTTFTHTKTKESLFFDYCQFLLASVTNWTQTYFANHIEKWSHVQLNRFLRMKTFLPANSGNLSEMTLSLMMMDA